MHYHPWDNELFRITVLKVSIIIPFLKYESAYTNTLLPREEICFLGNINHSQEEPRLQPYAT